MTNDTGLAGQPFILSADCIEHLWLYSNGHPGGIKALLNILMDAKVSIGRILPRLDALTKQNEVDMYY